MAHGNLPGPGGDGAGVGGDGNEVKGRGGGGMEAGEKLRDFVP